MASARGQQQTRRSAMKLGLLAVAIAGVLLPCPAAAVPIDSRDEVAAAAAAGDDPFQPIDPQNWVNPDLMTWADYKYPPGVNWSDASRKGSIRNFNIALIALDYDDRPFVVTQPVNSTVFSNPQPQVSNLARSAVPAYYRDLLNKPQELNHYHTLHEYWMEDSQGRYGVDLTSFGPYKLPSLAYQYGIDTTGFNPGACPAGKRCNIDLRTDALAAWRNAVGNATADSYELVFILSAGQDESSTWQEFGEMKFQSPQDVPASFGPPAGSNKTSNAAKTRYVDWTSWVSASTIWPNAGRGSSTQGESSGMAVYAHELSHLLKIGDNYNNPYGVPLRRAYTGPWSMMSRGSFNGPGGPHSRWKIPAIQGGSQGSLHTMRDKTQLGLIANTSVLSISREALAKSGPVVARITARSVNSGLMGLRVSLDGAGGDRSPYCNTSTQVLCDGGGWNKYDVEVVDRMGSDSFTPDSGVMISKTRDTDAIAPFQWTIDANPQDIKLVDFTRPNGSIAMITLGDYRQLLDALFHAGTGSGSQFEYIDEPNRLHFYILNRFKSNTGVVSYDVGVKSLDAPTGAAAGSSKRGVSLLPGIIKPDLTLSTRPTKKGVTCEFKLFNTGSYTAPPADGAQHPQDVSAYLKSDVYRLTASVEGKGWRVQLPNALATAQFGGSTTVKVAVMAEKDAALATVVKLTAVSEGDKTKSATGWCAAVRY